MPNNYTIIREIGKGGMGCVYEATNPNGERVALKMMRAELAYNPDYREFFNAEAKALSKMDKSRRDVVHTDGATFSDSEGNFYLPMDFIEGETILSHVKKYGPYNEEETLSIFEKILDAFSYIHSVHCIHRDVKPSNIMVRPDGSVCIIDFGIAKDAKFKTGHTVGRVVGTDGYMSYEQAAGLDIDSRTDIYSLGCLLHFMLVGRDAILKGSNDMETRAAIMESEFPSAQHIMRASGVSISDKTQNAIFKAVDKDMRRRYQTANDFKRGLFPKMIINNGTKVGNIRVLITVGRNLNCDIVINDPNSYVSSNHLEIEYIQVENTGSRHSYMLIKDTSTNGTGIDGRYLHNATETVNFSLETSTNALPTVYLAGRPEYLLDWHKVKEIIRENVGPEVLPPPPPPPPVEELGVGLRILSFLPIVGWILWGVWKDDNDKQLKAKQAAKCAWIGFAFGIAMNIIFMIISIASL